jgi:hypothetical protein
MLRRKSEHEKESNRMKKSHNKLYILCSSFNTVRVLNERWDG